jgi:hypothetical protein
MYDNKRKVVLSLYDFTGEALKPWAQAGYECYAYDIQHDDQLIESFKGGGSIQYLHADLHSYETICAMYDGFKDQRVSFAMAFPVCTDMAVVAQHTSLSKLRLTLNFQD